MISSAWHKLTNIFGGGKATTEAEEETRKEFVVPEDRMPPPNGREDSGRDLRMAPLDFSRRDDEDNEVPPEGYDEGES